MKEITLQIKQIFGREIEVQYTSHSLVLKILGIDYMPFNAINLLSSIKELSINMVQSYHTGTSIFVHLHQPITMSVFSYSPVPSDITTSEIQKILNKNLPTFELETTEVDWMAKKGINVKFTAKEFGRDYILFEDVVDSSINHLIHYKEVN